MQITMGSRLSAWFDYFGNNFSDNSCEIVGTVGPSVVLVAEANSFLVQTNEEKTSIPTVQNYLQIMQSQSNYLKELQFAKHNNTRRVNKGLTPEQEGELTV